jgi:hypothetical protein
MLRRMVLELDYLDFVAIQRAIARRQRWRDEEGGAIMPPTESNTAGAVLAEICRGWEELLNAAKGA